MAAFVATVRNTMLDWLTGKSTPATVATRYITTYNGDPQGGGAENISTITGSANRIDMTTAMAAASSGSAVSNADITFTSSASAGATVDYIAVFSAITGGTVYASAAVTSKTLTTGDSLKIPSGSLTFSIT
jgi:hypothetical protein